MISVIAYVYAVILVQPDMILHHWYKWLEAVIGKYQWLFNPIIGCEKCVAGQIALWFYLIHTFVFGHDYYFIDHLFLITYTIILTFVIKKIHEWTIS